jgi:hypothetical protein
VTAIVRLLPAATLHETIQLSLRIINYFEPVSSPITRHPTHRSTSRARDAGSTGYHLTFDLNPFHSLVLLSTVE